MSITKTMTLNLQPREMEAVEALADEHGMSKTAILRQALRLYQLTNERLKAGETMHFSGDEGRAIAFVGIGFSTPQPNVDEGDGK